MATNLTNNYDVLLLLAEKEMERLVRTAFFENLTPDGLPYVYTSARTDGSFSFRFGVPDVSLFLDLPLKEQRDREKALFDRMILITLPFNDSYIIINTENNTESIYLLKGTFKLTAEIINDAGQFRFTNLMFAHFEFAEDDPDPNNDNRTSKQKFSDPKRAVLESLVEDYFIANPPEFLTSLSNSGMEFLSDNPLCPVDSVNTDPGKDLITTVPEGIKCNDVKIVSKGSAFLIFRMKLSELSFNKGTDVNNEVNTGWFESGNRVGVVIANRFLLQEALPFALAKGLCSGVLEDLKKSITDEVNNDSSIAHDDKESEVNKRYAEKEPEKVKEFFSFPFNLLKSIPLKLPLPTLEEVISTGGNPPDAEIPETPNGSITGVSMAVPVNGTELSSVDLVVSLSATADGYNFTANIPIHLKFSAGKDGKLSVNPKINEDEVQVDFRFAAGVAPALPGLLAPLIILLIIPLLLVFVAQALVSFFSRGIISRNVQQQLPASGGDNLPQVISNIFLTDVKLDDLVLKGMFVFGHVSGSQSDNGIIKEKICIKEQASFNEDGNGRADINAIGVHFNNPMLTFDTDIEIAVLDERFSGDNAYDIFSQADARNPRLNFSSRDINLNSLFIQSFLNLPTEFTVPFAVRNSVTGIHAILTIRKDFAGLFHFFFRSYKQKSPASYLSVNRNIEGDPLLDHDLTQCLMVENIAEEIELPMLFDGGRPVMGTMRAGVKIYSCALNAVATLYMYKLVSPIENIQWSVLLSDGSRVNIPVGTDFVCNVSPGAAEPANVRFRVENENLNCFFIAEQNRNGTFTLNVSFTERYTVVHSHSQEINFRGRKVTPYGFDRVFRWLERVMLVFQKLEGIEIVPSLDPPCPIEEIRETTYIDDIPGTGMKDGTSTGNGFDESGSVRETITIRGCGGVYQRAMGARNSRTEYEREKLMDATGMKKTVNAYLNIALKKFPDNKKLKVFNKHVQNFLEKLPDTKDLEKRATR